MHPTEEKIWRLLPALEKLRGDAQTVAFAHAAADNLRQLVANGVFGTLLVDQPLALMQTIENDRT